MKTRKYRLLICSFILALLVQMMSITVFAEEIVSPKITIDDGGVTGTEIFEVPNLPVETDGIEKESIPAPGSRGRNINTPPVANLAYIVLNPETLKNGAFTTDTMIAWLWSYNGVNYTYDPDGDAITNINLGGIPSSSIVGYLEGNIGFVTLFSTSAQYIMTYQVQDARGALSNTLELVLNIEPSDDNTRPYGTAVFSPSSGEIHTKQAAKISWADYKDDDDIDYIAEARGYVYKDGGAATDLSNYVESFDEQNMEISLRFKEVGTYEVWFSVRDRWSAWSDWNYFTYTVSTAPPVQMTEINYSQLSGGPAISGAYWFNQSHAYERTSNGQTPLDYLAQYGQSAYPLNSTAYVGGTWSVSGRFMYGNGTPVESQNVDISIYSIYPLYCTVQTDSNGYFVLNLTQSEYFANLRNSASGFYEGSLEGISHYSWRGTASHVNAELEITCDDASYSYPVAQLIGVSARQIVGNRLYDRSSGQWLAFH